MGERLHAKAFCEIFMEEASEKFFEEEKAVKQQKRLLRCRSAEGVSSYDVIVAFFRVCATMFAPKKVYLKEKCWQGSMTAFAESKNQMTQM